MKFVRFEMNERIAHGVLEDDIIREISGSIFGEFEITSVEHMVSDVLLLSPVEPSKVICVGLNYREHIVELNSEMPEFPSHFIKPPTALSGPEAPIIYPRIARRVDYEGELAVVIRDEIKDIPQEEALEHVLGYTCLNDVTERTLTKVFGQLTRAKGFDSFAPFGPCVATDLDPFALTVQTLLNGRIVQEGQVADMVFSVPFLIHYVSQCMTLLPGDLISTGTPSGVGPMNPGDVVEVHVEGIGTLRNPVKGLD